MMMSVNITCPNQNCGKMLRVAEKFLGLRVKCKFCGQPLLVERQDQSLPAPVGLQTMDLPVAANVFEQQTVIGAAPSAATLPDAPLELPPPTDDWEQSLPRVAPAASGPPPLPPKPPRVKVGALVVSLFSLGIICGSLAGIIVLRKPAETTSAAAAPKASKYAVIALASDGVRLVVAPIHRTADGYSLEEPILEDRRAPLAARKGDEGLDPDRVSAVMDVVRELVQTARAKGVGEKDLFVVCNDKVLKELDQAAATRARATLDAGVKNAGGGTLDYISLTDEARFCAIGCIPEEDRKAVVLLDLGSGGVVGGYYDSSGAFIPITIPELGRRAFIDSVNKSKRKFESFSTAAATTKPLRLNAPFQRAKKDHPALENRTKYHLVGGSAWAAAAYTHPDALGEKRVALTVTDIQNFDQLVSNSPTVAAARETVLKKVPPGSSRERADRVFAELGDSLDLDNLIASAKIVTALAEECQFQGKEVRFFTKGLFAWPVGYLLTRTGVEK